MKRFGLYIAVMCMGTLLHAQLSFTFLPELYGRHTDGLGSFQVWNRGQVKMPGKVIIQVKENRSHSVVVTVMTPEVDFMPGQNSFPKAVYNRSLFTFGANPYGSIAGQTRNLPPGDYTFCFRYIPSDKALFNEEEDCFDAEIQPMVPLSLLDPEHLDTLCDKRPSLSWQPPIPFSPGMRYRLILTEKKGDDQAIEDLTLRTPLLLLDGITANRVNYPSSHPELKEGSTYFWQVIVYEKGLILGRSEIWEFTVRCREVKPPIPADSYRELKQLVNGNYYIANRAIRFSYRNDYNMTKLRYAILDISKGRAEIRDVPEINIQPGFNKVDIDLTDLDLVPGGQYVLKVYPFNESPVEIRFIYQDSDTGL